MTEVTRKPIEVQAAELLAQVDPADVSAVLADYPEPEDIELRAEIPKPYRKKPMPTDGKLRVVALREEIERCRKTLEVDIERYNELRRRGLDAVTHYDIVISSGGNPTNALRTALRLKQAHISYAMTMGHGLQLELAKTLKEIGEAPQLALF